MLLQLVGLDFVHQTDATAFLVHIDQNALALFLYHLHSQVQLLAALTTHRAKDVTRGTRGVYTHQNGFARSPFTLNEGDVFTAIVDLPEGDEFEVAILGGKIHLVTDLNHLLGA